MIRVAGVGPGNPKYLTAEVLDLIKSSDRVIAFKRVAETYFYLRADIDTVKTRSEILELLDIYDDKDVLVLASGDPLLYGITDFLMRNAHVDEVCPGISSVQYMMSRLKKSCNDLQIISAHGREYSLDELDGKKIIFLTDNINTPDYLSRELGKRGFKGKLYAGFDLSYDDEKIIEFKIGEEINEPSTLAVLYAEVE